ncbi:MAG: bifunctional metallophosphatase/5'-nucleotidase [Sphaerochaetaceae bacterium]
MATLYYTSDMHSYLYDTDYVQKRKIKTGYFQLARHFDPDALVIDGGDVLQGSPLARQIHKTGFKTFVQAEAMNAAGVNVFVPGNHDFNFGYGVLKQFVSQLDAHLVCANLRDASGSLAIEPWYIHTGKDGIRIGVVGVVTDYVNIWEDAQNLGPMQILDSLKAAESALTELRRQHVDYTVCVYHGGYDENSHGNTRYRENRSTELAALGFDTLLTAHQHMKIDPTSLGDTMTMQCGSNAAWYAKLLFMKTGIDASLLASNEGAVFPHEMLIEVEKRYMPLQEEILASLAGEIGRTEVPFEDTDKLESAVQGSRLADFFNQIQLTFSEADISCVSLFNQPRSLGPLVTAGDILAAYPFPNTLVVLEVDGVVLKNALERCASYFSLNEERIQINKDFLEPKIEHYNYDYYQNIDYGFSLRNQVGQRVVKLSYQGRDLLKHPDVKLRLVMNNYRATGTGGYEMFLDCPVIQQYKTEVQDLLFRAFEKNAFIPVPPASCYFVRF